MNEGIFNPLFEKTPTSTLSKKEILMGNNDERKRIRASHSVEAQLQVFNYGAVNSSSPIQETDFTMVVDNFLSSQIVGVKDDISTGTSNGSRTSTMRQPFLLAGPGLSEVMKILSWNVRGLGQHRAFPILLELIKTHVVDVVFLFETLINSYKIEALCVKLGFADAFSC